MLYYEAWFHSAFYHKNFLIWSFVGKLVPYRTQFASTGDLTL